MGLQIYISFALQQKTANFKVAVASSTMQGSGSMMQIVSGISTEEKQKNQLAQTELRFIKTITIIV